MIQDRQPQRPLVSVIVPTLNEAETIDALLAQLFALEPLRGRLEVVIADDHSSDGTADRVRHWARSHPVRLVQRDGAPDLAASVVAGARAARGDWVVVMDADGSHPVELVPKLVESLIEDRADITLGSRHVSGGGIRDWSWWRHLVSRAATLLAWPFTSVQDPMSGFFATRRERLAARPERRGGYKILLELLVQSGDRPRVEEVPFRFRDRQAGESKMGLTTQWLLIQRLAALGGARLNLGNASKFALVGLGGLMVDLVTFQILFSLGLGLASAHSLSFLAATVSNFLLNYHWTFARGVSPGESRARRYLRFLGVALMALMLRGGVLAALVGMGVAPLWAIVPAVIVTAGINYLGSIFYVFPDREHRAPPRVRWHLAALGLICYVFALRFLYLSQTDLILDEMYYWTWGLHPALSYLDHPPLVAWLIGIGTWLAGDSILGVRLLNLLLGPLTAWFAYAFGRDLVGKSAGLMAALLVFLLPAYFAGGFLMTPDAPLLAAWAAALYYFQRALVQGEARAFYGLGLAMGLGLLSKYTIVLLAPAALLFILMEPRARQWLRRPQPYLAVAIATLVFLPVLIWNWQNDWASFSFQGTRRLGGAPAWSSHHMIVFLLLMLAPLAGFVALYVLGPVRHLLAPNGVHRRFILTMTLVPAGLFAVIGIFSQLKFHWTLPLWLAILPLVGATLIPHPEARERFPWLDRIQRLWPPLLICKTVAFGALLHYIAMGLPGVAWPENTRGYLGWPEIAKEIHRLERELELETGKRPIVAGMSKWSVAAALTFHDPSRLPDNITSRNIVGRDATQWERWFDPATDPDRPLILVSYERKLIASEWLESVLPGLGPLQKMPIYREGQRVQTLYYRLADGFRPESVKTGGDDLALCQYGCRTHSQYLDANSRPEVDVGVRVKLVTPV